MNQTRYRKLKTANPELADAMLDFQKALDRQTILIDRINKTYAMGSKGYLVEKGYL